MKSTARLRSIEKQVNSAVVNIDELVHELGYATANAVAKYLKAYDDVIDVEDEQMAIALDETAEHAMTLQKIRKGLIGISKVLKKSHREITDLGAQPG